MAYRASTYGLSLLLTVFLINMGSTGIIAEEAEGKRGDCVSAFSGNLIKPKADESDLQTDSYALDAKRYSVQDLLAADPSTNLFVRHPAMVMSSPQVIYSWIRRHPAKQIIEPGIGGKIVNQYPLFSEHLPENSEALPIVGQFEAVQTLVDSVVASARGDGARFRTPIFIGPAGTGKTAFLDIIYSVGRYLTERESDYFMFTF